jgi:DNA helicase-2/ATP-dependent DNA helicase PcrA
VASSIAESRLTGKYGLDHSVAIIYRTNIQSRAFEEACVQKNLPYVIFGSATSFYKRLEIKDCLAFLRWMYNGRDRSAMLRAMTSPKRGIGERAIEEFDRYCGEVEGYYESNLPAEPLPTPFDVLLSLSVGPTSTSLAPGSPSPVGTISTRPAKIFNEFSHQIRSLYEKAQSQSLEEVLDAFIGDFKFLEHVEKISKSRSEIEERKASVTELQIATQRYTKLGPCLSTRKTTNEMGDEFAESALGTFLDDVALVTDMSEKSADERFVVNLMTVHASKGMEFDTVFVVGNEDGTFPTYQVRLQISLHFYRCLCLANFESINDYFVY